MIGVIETNILIKDGVVMDHQSRTLRIDSWYKYVNYYTNYNGKACGYINMENSSMAGHVLLDNCKIEDLQHTEGNLNCYILKHGFTTLKLAYNTAYVPDYFKQRSE